MSAVHHDILPSYELGGLHVQPGPSFIGLGVELVLLVALILTVRLAKKSSVAVVFESIYEQAFLFFEDILGKAEKYWVKSFIVTMFFVILFSNVMGIIFEILGPVAGIDEVGHANLAGWFAIPTADLNFNMAMATMSVILMLYLQWKHGSHIKFAEPKEKISTIGAGIMYLIIIAGAILGILGTMGLGTIVLAVLVLALGVDALSSYFQSQGMWKGKQLKSNRLMGVIHALHEYLPVTGKNILTAEKGNKSWAVFVPMWLLVKSFDILISLFLGMLEIIGLFAKILSLSFRLYGNMIAGGILLGILLAAMASAFDNMVGYNITLVAPIIVHLQAILVGLIQALVFPLLVAIFFKVAQAESEA